MCVDDYEFRHQTAVRQKICRRFVFKKKDGNQRIFLVNISQFQESGLLRLCDILLHLNKKGLDIKEYMFYLPQFNITIQAGDKCKIPFDLMTDKQIIFEMTKIEQKLDFDDIQIFKIQISEQQCFVPFQIRKNDSMSDHENIVEKNFSPIDKKCKEHQKTIQQALFDVKQWRALHQKNHLSLKNAANIVGFPKKTLDDQYFVLRVGEELGYNFKQNMNSKIGHLRSFIRHSPIKIKGRLQKNLQAFSLVPQPDTSVHLHIKEWSKTSHIQQIDGSIEHENQNIQK